ncbi:MAG: YjjG family noncanonical pyrimidine nucleotidase [Marinilabiliales bacterium]|nr:YjjG family noncanonical pyrimidine nucleotidase [Marinilabiliales bacterium]
MKYTHLFFDLDNTLWDFNANARDALYLALDRMNLMDHIGDFDKYFPIYYGVNEKLWDLYRDNKITKAVLGGQRFEESLALNGTPLPGIGGQLNLLYLEEMPRQLKLVPGARELLHQLHRDYKMAIITNGFKEVQAKKLINTGIHGYFEKLFISEEIGAQKPHRLIFEHALKSMNAPKKSSLMIGDSWDADILGARDFGIDQVYLSTDPLASEKVSANPDTKTRTLHISHLSQLATIL